MTVSVATLGERALRRLGVAIVPEASRPALVTTVPAATLATSALVELGVIAADETPSDSDQALALSKVNAVHDSLVAQSYARWTIGAVPQAVAEEYVKLTAQQAASSFGKPGDLQIYTALEQRVRRVAMLMQAIDEATQAVMAVHTELTAQGRIRWSVFDVPPSAESAYSILAAARLAPSFAQQTDPRDEVEAYRTLARIVALEPSGERTYAEYF